MNHARCLTNSSGIRSGFSRWTLSVGVALLASLAVPTWAEASSSPCQGSLDALAADYADDPATRAAFQVTYDGLKRLPPG